MAVIGTFEYMQETGNKKDSLLFVYWYLTVIIDSRLFPHSPVQTRCITTHPQNLSIFIHSISIKPYHNSENIFEAVITKLFGRTIPVVHVRIPSPVTFQNLTICFTYLHIYKTSVVFLCGANGMMG